MRTIFLAAMAALACCAATPLSARDKPLETIGTSGPIDWPTQEHPCQRGKGTEELVRCLPPIGESMTQSQALRARLARARFQLQLHNGDAALEEIKLGLALGRPTVGALHLAARIWLSNYAAPDRIRLAAAYMAPALRMAPADPHLLATQGYIARFSGRLEDAERLYLRALKAEPTNTFALSQMAQHEYEMGRLQSAHARYDVLIQIQPSNPEWLMARGVIRLAQHLPQAAIADLTRYIDAGRRDSRAYYLRAKAYGEVGKHAEAIADLSVLIDGLGDGMRFALAPQQIGAFLMARSMLLLKSGDQEAAAADLLNGVGLGDHRGILALQVFLANRGIAVDVDGQKSEQLRQAIASCFATIECAEAVAKLRKVPEAAQLQ